jgi:hypothetical protein
MIFVKLILGSSGYFGLRWFFCISSVSNCWRWQIFMLCGDKNGVVGWSSVPFVSWALGGSLKTFKFSVLILQCLTARYPDDNNQDFKKSVSSESEKSSGAAPFVLTDVCLSVLGFNKTRNKLIPCWSVCLGETSPRLTSAVDAITFDSYKFGHFSCISSRCLQWWPSLIETNERHSSTRML